MKRVKVKLKSPNPLFISWLEDWKEDAISKGSEMQHCFARALKSLKKYPLPLQSGRECIILENFGPKLCAMLDKKLIEYRATDINNPAFPKEAFSIQYDKLHMVQNTFNNVKSNNKGQKVPASCKRATESEARIQPIKKTKTPETREDRGRTNSDKTGPYIPTLRSGGYAILLTLYEKAQDPDYIGYMTKADLQDDAQKYCDNSLKKCEPGSRYTAWSSMSTLIERKLVIRNSNPAKYRLTDAGLAVAIQLSEIDVKNTTLGSPSAQCDSIKRGLETSVTTTEKGSRVSNDGFTIESSRSSSWDQDEQLELLSNLPSPIYNCGDKRNIRKNFETKKNEEGILIENNNKNMLKEKKTALQMKKISNHQQILNINEGFDSQQSSSSGDEQTTLLKPQTFDVILLVDDRETAGGKTRPKDDMTIAELTRAKIRFEICNLKIGDFTWIARCRDSAEELILPYIVERKRMDDFGGSIKDGRYYEQKFRLKKSGIQNITYLIENHGSNQFSGLPVSTLLQAATNTLVQDGFYVKYTKSHKESMFYLASITDLLTKIYQGKTLVGCKKEDLIPVNTVNDLTHLMVFKDFNKAAAKVRNFKAKEMFLKHLIQLRGMSVEKALAIVEFYPTPISLKNAFEDVNSSGENLLAGIQYGSTKRQLGPALSKTLYQFYTKKDF